MTTQPHRRDFLAAATVGVPAVATLGLATAVAKASTARRRVVPGAAGAPFSRAVVCEPLVFVSGVLGTRPGSRELVSPDFEPQARQVLENLKASVESSGATMANVLKCTCFLTDEGDFATFNQVYITFFREDPPARSTVIVKALVLSGAKVEVDCVAALV